MQKAFLTLATGGPHGYSGKSMKEAHRGRGITQYEFDQVAKHVIASMNELGVDEMLVSKVVEALLGLKDDIIDPPIDNPSGVKFEYNPSKLD